MIRIEGKPSRDHRCSDGSDQRDDGEDNGSDVDHDASRVMAGEALDSRASYLSLPSRTSSAIREF